MSEFKATPGPWHPCIGNSVRNEEIIVAQPFTDGTSGPVASDAEQQANARLIAAAPEMYQELDALLSAINMGNGQNGPFLRHAKSIERLLAKARGEQQ